MAPSKPVSFFNVKTPLEASSESKHSSDLPSLFFSLPHPYSPLHGHHHRLHFTPSSLFHASTSADFSPHLLPSSPLFLLFFPALVSSHRFARSPVCLLRPVILTALLLLLPRPSVISFPSSLSPLSVRISIVLIPFLLSLTRPSFSPSSSCFSSSPPCLSPP